MVTRHDVKVSVLFMLGFIIAYLEGYAMEYFNKIYDPESWYLYQSVCWTVVFGIIHAIVLVYFFAGGRFNWRCLYEKGN